MKKLLLLCLLVAILNGALAQTPRQINYQGIARNTAGAVIANQPITLRLSIHESKPTGVVVYKETRNLKTNGFGLFTTAIGSPGAMQVVGSLAAINWENSEPKYLQVEMDPTGVSTFIDMGTSELLSVPFAFYAEKASPTGPAGGDLTGGYPSPVIKNDAISTAKLANGAVTTTKLAASAVGTSQIQDGAITASKLAPGLLNGGGNNGANGQAGGDLTGSYPNPLIANSAVGETKLSDGAVSTTKLQDGAVTLAKLAPGIIPTSLPPNGAASGDLTGTYPNPLLKDGAVNTAKLQDGAVTSDKLAAGVIPSSLPPIGQAGGDLTGSYPNPLINPGAITTDKIAAGAITADKIAPGVIPASLPASGAAGGDLQGTYPNPTLKTGIVTTGNVQDGAITASKLAPGVIPSMLPPTGNAGGDLSGNYPNPILSAGVVVNSKLADGAVSTVKVQDGAITSAKLAPGTIPTSLPPSGAAGGELAGSYPNPTIANGVVTTNKIATGAVVTEHIADGTIIATKLATGVIPTALPPIGTAGGDLTGSYPNPVLAVGVVSETKLTDGAVTSIKIKDGAITSAKLAPGVLPATLPPTGAAGGDLSGFYPNPIIGTDAVTSDKIAAGAITTIKLADKVVDGSKLADGAVGTVKLVDASVTAAKLAPGIIPSTLPPSGAAAGDLTGTYPNPLLKDGAVTTTKLATDAVGTLQIQDGAITAAKLAPGLLNGGGNNGANGQAGGDLTGTYPNPLIANGVVTGNKIATGAIAAVHIVDGVISTAKLTDASVTGTKIADGTITISKLAPGTIPTSLPPSGTASGDLSGTYPSPAVASLKGTPISNTVPVTGQVLKFDGSAWGPSVDNTGALSLPFSQTVNHTSPVFSITNQSAGASLAGLNSKASETTAVGVLGQITSTSPGQNAAGVKGVNQGTTMDGYGVGVWGEHTGSGSGIYGISKRGSGVFGTSEEGIAGQFDISNSNSSNDVVFAYNSGRGNGVTAISNNSYGLVGIANALSGSGVIGFHNAGGEGVFGTTRSEIASGVVGRNNGSYAGVKGFNTSDNGIGVLAVANVNDAANGTALVAELEGAQAGNLAVFKANGINVARIDHTGKAFFNGNVQVGGADLAEYFDVEGSKTQYEPGDVLIISQSGDRKVEKSSTPYSTLVAGVYATKPGLMLTERNAEQNQLDDMVPMGVIGVIPTKVCLEGGVIHRGDLLVTSSIPGVAMKADTEKVRVGQVLGKALQDYSSNGTGKINVLVSVK